MNIREILVRRDAIRTELRSLLDAAPDGSLGDEARARADALEAEAGRLNEQERRVALLDELDRRAAGTPVSGGSGDSNFDALAAQVTAVDCVRAQMGATDAAAGRAREVSAELERRSGRRAEGILFHAGMERRVLTSAAPAAGSLIATVVSPTLIDRLRERIVVRALGATVLTGLQGNLNIPRLKSSATASWVAENSPITASEPQLDSVGFTPKHVGGIVELSRNLLQQPSADVARLVESDLAQLVAGGIDRAALKGGGSNEPVGILGASGIGDVAGGATGAAITWANIVALIGAVDSANALGGSLAFATNAKVTKAMRTTLKSAGDTSSNFIQTEPNNLAGYTLASTQNVPGNLTKSTGTNLSALIFGDWSQLVIGFWSELDILVNPYESTAYSKGNVQVRVMATADVQIRQPAAFAAIKDIVAA